MPAAPNKYPSTYPIPNWRQFIKFTPIGGFVNIVRNIDVAVIDQGLKAFPSRESSINIWIS